MPTKNLLAHTHHCYPAVKPHIQSLHSVSLLQRVPVCGGFFNWQEDQALFLFECEPDCGCADWEDLNAEVRLVQGHLSRLLLSQQNRGRPWKHTHTQTQHLCYATGLVCEVCPLQRLGDRWKSRRTVGKVKQDQGAWHVSTLMQQICRKARLLVRLFTIL